MQLILHREIPEDDGALRRQWNELVFQMESPEVFYTYEWALAVQRAYSSSMLPLMMLAYERDSLVGVAALATGVTRESAFFLAASRNDSAASFWTAVFRAPAPTIRSSARCTRRNSRSRTRSIN